MCCTRTHSDVSDRAPSSFQDPWRPWSRTWASTSRWTETNAGPRVRKNHRKTMGLAAGAALLLLLSLLLSLFFIILLLFYYYIYIHMYTTLHLIHLKATHEFHPAAISAGIHNSLLKMIHFCWWVGNHKFSFLGRSKPPFCLVFPLLQFRVFLSSHHLFFGGFDWTITAWSTQILSVLL